MVMEMTTNFSCGNRIRELRSERKISQEQLALAAGITPAYLGMVERGLRNATVLTIERLCEALGITLAEFFSPDHDDCRSFDKENQIAYLIKDLNAEEKSACVQLIKDAVLMLNLRK